MKVFVISDTHIGHNNIIKFVDSNGNRIRPFESLDEMHQLLLNNWNSVVSDDDVVYHLGDVGFHRVDTADFLSKAKGKKHLILGNHDNFPMSFYEGYFNSIKVSKRFTLSDGTKLMLSHYPIHDFSLHGFDVNVHGHIHDKVILDNKYKNVSVENIGFCPIEIEGVMKL